MKRREFLINAAALAGAGVVAGKGWGQPLVRAQQSKLDRVSIMAWSFDQIIKRGDEDATNPKKTLDIMELPKMYADRYGVHNIEMQQVHFSTTENDYFRAFKAKVDQAKSRVTQINLEFMASLSAPEQYRRLEAVELTRRWIDHAVLIGAPRVMVNQGTLAPENRQGAIEALRAMAAYGKTKNVRITMENRGGNYAATQDIILASGIYANVDLGFPDQESQLAYIRATFAQNSGNVHVKLNPTRYDLAKTFQLYRELGYTGMFSIEAGTQNDPYENVQKIYDVILANL
jgi:sugar phosphate isomerase/epimerase